MDSQTEISGSRLLSPDWTQFQFRLDKYGNLRGYLGMATPGWFSQSTIPRAVERTDFRVETKQNRLADARADSDKKMQTLVSWKMCRME